MQNPRLMRRIAPVALAFLLALSASTRADWKTLLGKPAPEPEFGTWTAAPEGESLADLRGKVVLLLLGGAAEDGGAKTVLSWNDLRAAYWDDGLRVVAVLGAAPEDASGMEFSTAVGEATAYGDGSSPRAVLVDAGGKVAWEGDPAKLPEAEIVALLRKARPLRLRPVAPELKAAATAFGKGQLGKAAALADEVPVAGDAADDAAYVVARAAAFLSYWQRQAGRASVARNLAEETACLEWIRKGFPDTDEATAAAARLKALKADAAAKKEVTAGKGYVRLRTEWVRAAEREKKIAALVKNLERFVKKSEGTKGAERAARMLDAIRTDPAIESIRAFIAQAKVSTGSSSWRKSLKAPPRAAFTKTKSYFWILDTNRGRMKLRLFPDVAPMHVTSTIYLTELGYYDGLIFHRVIPGFMAQGGCPDGSGSGGPGYSYDGEFARTAKHDRAGILSMAHSGPGTDGSQFFITLGPTPHLDMKHTVFGAVVEGMETLREIEKLGSSGGATKERIVIEKAAIEVE